MQQELKAKCRCRFTCLVVGCIRSAITHHLAGFSQATQPLTFQRLKLLHTFALFSKRLRVFQWHFLYYVRHPLQSVFGIKVFNTGNSHYALPFLNFEFPLEFVSLFHSLMPSGSCLLMFLEFTVSSVRVSLMEAYSTVLK